MGMFRPIVRNFRLKKVYHALFGNRLLGGAHRVIATSERGKQELIDGDIGSVRIVVRRNCINVPGSLPPPGSFREKRAIPRQAKVILFSRTAGSEEEPRFAAGCVCTLARPNTRRRDLCPSFGRS